MTEVTGTIQGVRTGQPESTDYGSLNVYYIDVVAPDGRAVQGGKLRAKTFEPKVGEEISVKVDASSDPPFLQKFNPEFDGQSSNGSNGSRPSGGRTDATGRSIERQVALKAAAEFYAGKTDTPVATIVATAEAFDEFLAASARTGGPPPSASPAADPPSAGEGANTPASSSTTSDVPDF